MEPINLVRSDIATSMLIGMIVPDPEAGNAAGLNGIK